MIDKYLKYGLLLSLSLLVGAFIWLFYNYLKIFSLFPIISFLALLSYTLFISRLYLNNLHTSKIGWLNRVVLLIISLPVFIGLLQFFDTQFYENYWPVVITLITIQSILGIMSGFGFFISRKTTPIVVNIVVLICGIYALAWSFLVLSKSVVDEVKLISFYVLLGVSIVIILGNLVMAFKKRD